MGFYHGFGTTRPCWVQSNILYYELSDGTIMQTACPLRVDIAKQCNRFRGWNIMFILEKDGTRFIGRTDGTFTGYRISDGAVTRIGQWTSPYAGYKLWNRCGTYHDIGKDARLEFVVQVDSPDIFYILNTNFEYVVKNGIWVDTIETNVASQSVAQATTMRVQSVTGWDINNVEGRWVYDDTRRDIPVIQFI